MADAVTLRLDASSFLRNARRLTDQQLERAMAKALNRTAFEVQDAERREVLSTFAFASSQTRQFLAGRPQGQRGKSFVFDRAKPGKLQVELYPRKKTERILRAHQKGALISGSQGGHLAYRGKLAVPATARRNARGKVIPADLPWNAARGRGAIEFKKSSRAFIAGRAILQREKLTRRRGRRRRSRTARVLFALVSVARLKPVFEFYNTARRTAEREFPGKAKQEFQKMRFRS